MIKLFVHTWLAQRHRLSTLKSSSHRAPLPLFVSEMISWTHPRSSELKPELSLTHPYSPSALSLKIPLIPPFLHLSSPSPQHHSPSRPPSPLTYIIASRPTGIPSGPECSQEAGQVLSLPVRCLYKPLLLSGLLNPLTCCLGVWLPPASAFITCHSARRLPGSPLESQCVCALAKCLACNTVCLLLCGSTPTPTALGTPEWGRNSIPIPWCPNPILNGHWEMNEGTEHSPGNYPPRFSGFPSTASSLSVARAGWYSRPRAYRKVPG